MPKKKDSKERPKRLKREIPADPGLLLGKKFVTPGLTDDTIPQQATLPTIEQMRELSNAELLDTLYHYGVFNNWEQYRTDSMAYVQRMTGISPDNPRFNELMKEYLDTTERRALLGMARRVSEKWSTLDSIEGKLYQEMIWIAEDDERTCGECSARSGEIKTYAEWQSIGPPGSSVCKGGDYCRCQLVMVG